jgi:hypothetical protein
MALRAGKLFFVIFFLVEGDSSVRWMRPSLLKILWTVKFARFENVSVGFMVF